MTRLQRIHTWAEHAARLAYMPPRLPKPQPLPAPGAMPRHGKTTRWSWSSSWRPAASRSASRRLDSWRWWGSKAVQHEGRPHL